MKTITHSAPMTQEEFRKTVGNTFFSVSFIKKDNTLRELNGRLGVQAKLRGGQDSTAHLEDYVNVYEKGADTFYRKVSLSRMTKLVAGGITHTFTQGNK